MAARSHSNPHLAATLILCPAAIWRAGLSLQYATFFASPDCLPAVPAVPALAPYPACLPAGLSPEYVTFTAAQGMKVGAGLNLLRPEALEAFWYMWRLTRDWRYRTWGWEVFQAFQLHAKVRAAGAGAAGRVHAGPVLIAR